MRPSLRLGSPLLGICALSLTVGPAQALTAEEDAVVETILRGLQDREAALSEFHASVLYRSWSSEAAIKGEKEWLRETFHDYEEEELQNRGLYLLDISYRGDQWAADSATVVAGGVWGSPLGGLTREPPGRKGDPDIPGHGALVTRSSSDGLNVFRWNLEHSLAEIWQVRSDPRDVLIGHPMSEMLLRIWRGDHFREYPPYAVKGPVDLDGRQCYLLSCGADRPEGHGPYRFQVWVAPSLGFSMVRTLSFSRDRSGDWGSRTDTRALGYQEVAPGVWFPTEVVSTRYSYRKGFQPPCNETRVYTVVGVQVGAGTAAGDAPFALRLPPGVMVKEYDGGGGLAGEYVTGFRSPEVQTLVKDFDHWSPPPCDPAFNRMPTQAEVDALAADAARGVAARAARGAGGEPK